MGEIIEDTRPIDHIFVPKDGVYIVSVSKNFSFDGVLRNVIDLRTNERLPYDTDTKILIYEDRQKTWFFEIADCLKLMNEAGFIVLMIATSYLEGNQQFMEGRPSNRGESESMFGKALQRIFPNQLDQPKIDLLYRGVRNGFFHSGITKKDIFISTSIKEVFQERGEGLLVINPHLFLDAIKKDFEDYILKLKNKENTSERVNFESFWDNFKEL